MALTTEEQKAFFLLMGISGQGVNLTDEVSIKRAFRHKAKKSHPDLAVRLGKDPRMMQLRFQELNEAFNILMERIQKEQKGAFSGFRQSPGNTPAEEPFSRKGKDRSKTSNRGFRSYKNSFKTEHDKDSPGAEKKDRKSDPGDFYFNGKTPGRNLRFAEYLYYSGTISWTDLVQALVWQYRNRPKIGEMATESGFLDFEDVLNIIKAKKHGELFGETAIRLGFLNREDLTFLIRKQKQLDLPIGRFFLDSSKMSKEALYKKLHENRRHNSIYDDDRSDS